MVAFCEKDRERERGGWGGGQKKKMALWLHASRREEQCEGKVEKGGGGSVNTLRRQSHSLLLPARRDLSQPGPGVVGRVDAVEAHVHGEHVEQLICNRERRKLLSKMINEKKKNSCTVQQEQTDWTLAARRLDLTR